MDDVAIFEIGKVFVTDESTLTALPQEKLLFSIVLTGRRRQAHWRRSLKLSTFMISKVFLKLVSYLGVKGLTYQSASPDGFHPGRTAELLLNTAEGKQKIGQLVNCILQSNSSVILMTLTYLRLNFPQS